MLQDKGAMGCITPFYSKITKKTNARVFVKEFYFHVCINLDF